MTEGQSDLPKCPYSDKDCPKLLNYIKNHEKQYEDLKKDMEFIKKLTIVLAVIVLGSDALGFVIL